MPERIRPPISPLFLLAMWCGLFILWLAPSQFEPMKYLGPGGTIVIDLAAAIGIGLLLWFALRFPSRPTLAWFSLLCVVVALLGVVIYPMANSGLYGVGSDRDDALRVTLDAALSGAYPYGVTTYLGNPPTPMPGAMLLALPFHLLGDVALQNLFWLTVLVFWARSRFRSSSLAFATLVVLLATPAILQDLTSGGDYFVNAIYVVVAADLALQAQGSQHRWARYLGLLFLCVAVSSRPVYAVVGLAVAAQVIRLHGAVRALAFSLGAAAICAAINLPLYLYDPTRFPTAHLLGKLDSQAAGSALKLLLPASACLIAGVCLRLRPTRANLFRVCALSLGVMLYPAFLLEMATPELGDRWMWTATFAAAVSVFGTLALMLDLDARLRKIASLSPEMP